MSIWRKTLPKKTVYQETPEWCQMSQAWVDAPYYELECYFKIEKIQSSIQLLLVSSG